MSRRRVPPPAALVVSVIYREEAVFSGALSCLCARFGRAGRVSDPFPFDRTDYYEREMGKGLVRRFVVFEEEVPRDSLAAAKIACEEIEGRLAARGLRRANIDPGLLTDENFVLATGKNYSHRVYLGCGVFADLALVFRDGDYRPLPWTYPDYAGDEIRAFLRAVREEQRALRRRPRAEGAAPCG